MVRVLFLLALILPASANTPEEAFREFTTFWMECSKESDAWTRLREESEAASDALRTDGLRAKRAEAREKAQEAFENTAIVWEEFEIAQTVPGQDSTTFIVHLNCRIRTPKFTEPGYTETDHREPYSFLFRKTGEDWRLAELWRVCSSCSGSTSCASCGGSGLRQGSTCAACDGSRTCTRCGGKSMVRDTLTHNTLVSLSGLVIAGDEFRPSTDSSTPESAAKAYMDSWTQRELVATRGTLAWLEPRWKTYLGMLTPENAAAAEQLLAMEVESGKKRYAGIRHEVTEARENGDLAFAQTIAVVDGLEHRCGLGMRRTADGWRVEAELTQKCVYCNGGGTCVLCKGAGKSETGACYGCNGKGVCQTCMGFGMVEGN